MKKKTDSFLDFLWKSWIGKKNVIPIFIITPDDKKLQDETDDEEYRQRTVEGNKDISNGYEPKGCINMHLEQIMNIPNMC